MPSWASVVRLLRRRLVLGIIFALSLTYCALSLLTHEKLGPALHRNNLQETEDSMIANNNEDLAIEDDADDDDFKNSDKHAWQLELDNYETGNLDSGNSPNNEFNGTLIGVKTCRNSVQGKALIVDERGFVCARSEVLPTGCCTTVSEKTNDEANDDRLSGKQRRYSCETCNPQGCCAIYEYCVSCCLQSGKKRGKKDQKNAGEKDRRESQKSRRGEDATKLRLRNLDRFQICLAACRTSSASVRHENTYKDPDSKHCYTHYQRNRRDDQMSNNNNEDNAAVVVTSSSMLSLLIPRFHHRNSEIPQTKFLNSTIEIPRFHHLNSRTLVE